ncbi:hypothetical protein PoB_004098000 [Plakobranchus ocellatus]|uniref:Uncharacterized protein n=1 Tax=Plakobranchus ocellatus TaxID=259542 RepID=A0AAV4B5Z7_9GAST|nr:hypothetical protein PoB_004098000 [Plakobranchus ocellatus]
MKARCEDVSEALLNELDSLKRIFKGARKEIHREETFLRRSLSEAEDALDQMSSPIASRQKRRLYQMCIDFA